MIRNWTTYKRFQVLFRRSSARGGQESCKLMRRVNFKEKKNEIHELLLYSNQGYQRGEKKS